MRRDSGEVMIGTPQTIRRRHAEPLNLLGQPAREPAPQEGRLREDHLRASGNLALHAARAPLAACERVPRHRPAEHITIPNSRRTSLPPDRTAGARSASRHAIMPAVRRMADTVNTGSASFSSDPAIRRSNGLAPTARRWTLLLSAICTCSNP